MDNFWIFIVIIGAVISLAQKSPKKASSSDDTPTADPQQELERQIRELLGEKPASKPAPAEQKRVEIPAPMPIPTPVITPKNRVDTATSITKPKQQSKIKTVATAKVATSTNKGCNICRNIKTQIRRVLNRKRYGNYFFKDCSRRDSEL